MRDAGRLAAAIEVLTQIDERHRPVRMALKNWGESARYAGSKDRAFVSGLVLDVLRRRRSLAWRMGDEGLRAAALGALTFVWDWPLERVADEFNRYATQPIEIATPGLRTLEISGVFSIDDNQALIAFLRSLEGVHVEVTATRIRVSQD